MIVWIKKVWDTFTFSDFLTIVAGIVSVCAAIFALFQKRAAAKSESEAKAAAKLAGEYHQSAKGYYDKMNEEIEALKRRRGKAELKEKAYNFVSISRFTNTNAVAKELDIPPEEAFNLLLELVFADKAITCAGQTTKENMNDVTWLKK